jgi:hypothetical protein
VGYLEPSAEAKLGLITKIGIFRQQEGVTESNSEPGGRCVGCMTVYDCLNARVAITPVRRDVNDARSRQIERAKSPMGELDIVVWPCPPGKIALDFLQNVTRQNQDRATAVQRPQQTGDPTLGARARWWARALYDFAHEHARISHQDNRSGARHTRIHGRQDIRRY